jgi:LmbE family N-acetylglucosaminyl deacetylase
MNPRPTVTETEWAPALQKHDIRPFPPGRYRKVVVVAAHPDDETLGASGFLQRLHAEGATVTLVIATDGEGAFPGSSPEDQLELGRTRRRELEDSLRSQGVGDIHVDWLGFPDSGLAGCLDELVMRLRPTLSDAEFCLLPWPGDPHPDHQAAGQAALLAAPITTHCWSYPIWLWHWIRPDDEVIPWAKAFRHELDGDQRRRKADGIAAFVSQLKPGPAGEDPILTSEILTHFQRDEEILFREPPAASAPHSRFAELYDDAADPWAVSTSWYERRKRAVALAALPRERYASAVEPACGIGTFTRDLATRCDELLAFDPVESAVARARQENPSWVDVRLGSLPGDLPEGPVDLVVFSEILYYLGDDDLAATVEGAVAALRPGGDLLAVHWRPWAPEAPRDAADAHRRLLGHPALEPVVEHVDEEFLLHVLRRR